MKRLFVVLLYRDMRDHFLYKTYDESCAFNITRSVKRHYKLKRVKSRDNLTEQVVVAYDNGVRNFYDKLTVGYIYSDRYQHSK